MQRKAVAAEVKASLPTKPTNYDPELDGPLEPVYEPPPDEARQLLGILYDGASIAQLSVMFHVSPADTKRKVRSCLPIGKRAGADVYDIREAASHLVTPSYDIETYMRNLNPTDLPPNLKKEFWIGEINRLKAMELTGQLWPTETVLDHITEVFKSMRLAILLIPDQLEREHNLSELQRGTIRRIADGLMRQLRVNLVEGFSQKLSEGPERGSEVNNGVDGYNDASVPVDEL